MPNGAIQGSRDPAQHPGSCIMYGRSMVSALVMPSRTLNGTGNGGLTPRSTSKGSGEVLVIYASAQSQVVAGAPRATA